jgi:chaperonin cofactor prefoldin
MAKSRVTTVAELVTRAEFRKRAKTVDKRFEAVDKRFDAMDRRFDELIAVVGETIANAVTLIDQNVARHIRASEERLRVQIRGVDDQYRDLPERVARLEEHTGLKR